VSILQSLVWGIVQGLTEFIPVSSSGHLVLLPWLLGWPTPDLTFDVVVHLGTLLALLAYYRREVRALLKGLLRLLRPGGIHDPWARLALLLALSAVPAALSGYLLNDRIEAAFGNPQAASLMLLGTALLLWAAERLPHGERRLSDLHWGDALVIGLAQCIALMPGISRSGTTIAAGLFRRLERPDAARFAFLMALPVVLGANAYELVQLPSNPQGVAWATLLAGFFAAAFAGYLALVFLIRHLSRRGLTPFAIYCLAFGALTLAFGLVH